MTVIATPASPTTPTITVTAFVTTIVETSGVSAATTGGIAGGIAGGFLLIGALAFIYITRGSRKQHAMDGVERGGGGGTGLVIGEPKAREEVRDTQIRYPDIDENIDSGRTQERM